VVVSDPFGNTASSPWTTVTVASSGTDSKYVKAVYNSQPTDFWRLGGTGAAANADRVGFLPLVPGTGVVPGEPGAIAGDSDTATRFDGTTNGFAAVSTAGNPPDVFSVEAWFKTTTTTGGRLVGWSQRNTLGSSRKHDRQIYMDNAGHVLFGAKPEASRVAVSSPKTYNDGAWHQAVGSLSKSGLKLYVDGDLVASNSSVTVGEHLSIGYWRIGGDTVTGWPSAPTSGYFNGTLDDISVYKQELSPSEISAHYQAATSGTPANQPPTAAFTVNNSDLKITTDGSGSSDPDGQIATYAWDFGDGGTGSGATASHTYAAAGTYTVKLTVTDDGGLTDSTTKSVTVTAGTTSVLAQDGFSRTVTGGWGSADVGGAWTRSGTATNFNVAGGVGTIRMGSAGAGPSATLNDVSSSNTEVSVSAGMDKAATGGGMYATVWPRIVANGDRYYVDTRWVAGGAVTVTLGRNVGSTQTVLQTQTVSGLSVAAGDRLNIRAQATGTSPTTFRAKVWKVGTTEPSAWMVSVTDSTASLQAAGAVGLGTYLSGSATNAPVTASFDDFWAGAPTP
jgi:PKD repeat protein